MSLEKGSVPHKRKKRSPIQVCQPGLNIVVLAKVRGSPPKLERLPRIPFGVERWTLRVER